MQLLLNYLITVENADRGGEKAHILTATVTIYKTHGGATMSINHKKKIICIISGSEVRYIDAKTNTVILIQRLVDGKFKGKRVPMHTQETLGTMQLPVVHYRDNQNHSIDVFIYHCDAFTVTLADREYSAVLNPILNDYIVQIQDVQEPVNLTFQVTP